MAAAGIVTQLDIDATDVARAFFFDRALKLLNIQIALEGFIGGQIIGRLGGSVDHLRAIHFDMNTGGWKQEVSYYESVGFDVNFCPDALCRSPLRRSYHIRKTENTMHFFCQCGEGTASFAG